MVNTKNQGFGEKLRTVRDRKGITLKEVASLAQVSESLVSQIERNKVSPSVDTLLAIAEALEIDLEYLFEDYKKNKAVKIISEKNRDHLVLNKVVYEQLSCINDGANRVEAIRLIIEPAGEKGTLDYGHSGSEIGIILEGSGLLVYGTETYSLNQGDTVSFSSDIPHILKNTGKNKIIAIWIITPPKVFKQ
jgi:transcriptional regulator with XRE-family HTH domain